MLGVGAHSVRMRRGVQIHLLPPCSVASAGWHLAEMLLAMSYFPDEYVFIAANESRRGAGRGDQHPASTHRTRHPADLSSQAPGGFHSQLAEKESRQRQAGTVARAGSGAQNPLQGLSIL